MIVRIAKTNTYRIREWKGNKMRTFLVVWLMMMACLAESVAEHSGVPTAELPIFFTFLVGAGIGLAFMQDLKELNK